MITEDHWGRTEILRRAFDFYKIWNQRGAVSSQTVHGGERDREREREVEI